MSDFFDTPTRTKARKDHKCIACCSTIPSGERYVQQSGFFDGHAFRNKFHAECFDELAEEGDFEFTACCIEPPERSIREAEGVE